MWLWEPRLDGMREETANRLIKATQDAGNREGLSQRRFAKCDWGSNQEQEESEPGMMQCAALPPPSDDLLPFRTTAVEGLFRVCVALA
jgi:hypothetical protein